MKNIIIFIIIIIIAQNVFFHEESKANNRIFFIDPSAKYNGDGTRGTSAIKNGGKGAYNSWRSVELEPDCAYYQKCNTTFITDRSIKVYSTNVLIGSYYLNNDREVLDATGKKPVIRRRNNRRGNVIEIINSNNTTLKNLDIRGGNISVYIENSDYFKITSCHIGSGTLSYGIMIRGSKTYPFGESNYGIVKNVIIDSNYKKYRQKRLMDGIVLLNGANLIKMYNNIIINWGHNCINIQCNSKKYKYGASYNLVYNNLLTCPDVPYCRGIETNGKKNTCTNNQIFKNKIINTSVRNQINGEFNTFANNIIKTVKNSKKKTYVTAQGVDLEAYADNVCENNLIANNLIMDCDETGIRIKESKNKKMNNIIANNIIYNCGMNAKGKIRNCGIIIKGGKNILENKFINNCVYSPMVTSKVYYRNRKVDLIGFNQSNAVNNDIIENNFDKNPQLERISKTNYRLSLYSPCLKKGTLSDIYKNKNAYLISSKTKKMDIGPFEIKEFGFKMSKIVLPAK